MALNILIYSFLYYILLFLQHLSLLCMASGQY